MVFNVLAWNLDDHVQNISFLMDRRGTWTLAPAYDLTYAYDPSNYWLSRHQMSLNGKTESLDRTDLPAAAHMNISRRRAGAIIDHVETALRQWMFFAEEAALSEPAAEQIRRLMALR